ncbi:MAG: S49 family peptidase [Deltaproteobacteria bacterium]|nr:S49 family peptidase [Deltaproteobacteria bacterium]
MKLVLGDALRGIGVTTHEVRRGERATMWSSMRRWSDGERTAIEAMMRATYDVFVDRVAAGRKLDRAAVEPIAQGRVWTGNDAKARGLVDAIGTLQDALDDAHTRGGVAPGTALEVYPPEPTLRDIIASLGQAQLSTGASLALVDRALAARAAEDAPGAPASGLVAAIAAPAARLHAGGRQIAPTLALARMLATVLALQESHVWAVSPAMWLLQPR